MSTAHQDGRLAPATLLLCACLAAASCGCAAEPNGRYLGDDGVGSVGMDLSLVQAGPTDPPSVSGFLYEFLPDSPFVGRRWVLARATYDSSGRFESDVIDPAGGEHGGLVAGSVRDLDGDQRGDRVEAAWRANGATRSLVLDRWLATRDGYERYACWSPPGTWCAPALGEPTCRIEPVDHEAPVYALTVVVPFKDGNGDLGGGTATLRAEGEEDDRSCAAAIPGATPACDTTISVALAGETEGTLTLTSAKLALPRGTSALTVAVGDAALPSSSNVVSCPVPSVGTYGGSVTSRPRMAARP